MVAAKFVAMTTVLISSIGWSDAHRVDPWYGRATYYAPGLMGTGSGHRAWGDQVQCPECLGPRSNDADRRYRSAHLPLYSRSRLCARYRLSASLLPEPEASGHCFTLPTARRYFQTRSIRPGA